MMAAMTKRSTRTATGGSRVRRLTLAFARPTIAMGLLVVGLLLATAFVAIAVQRNAMARETAGLQADIITQQARRARLEAELAEKSGDSYIVDKAREYGYVKPGEALIGVKQEPKAVVVITPLTAPSRAEQWLTLFFGAR